MPHYSREPETQSPVTIENHSAPFRLSVADIVFEPKFDAHFQSVVSITDALFGTMGVRISFPSGDLLRTRAINSGELFDMPLNATLCGMAVQKGVSLEFGNAQASPEANTCPAVQKSGIEFYANRLIRVRGGEIVGTLCIYDKEQRTLSDKERSLLDSLGELLGRLVQGIVDSQRGKSAASSTAQEPSVSLTSLDFTTLFEYSPIPTAVLSYPDCRYVAANNLMVGTNGIPLDDILGNFASELQSENGDLHWLPEFHQKLDQDGIVKDMELKTRQSNGSYGYMLLDARFIQFDGESHVLITGRDITEEKERTRSLRLLLEGTNIRLGDDWFRGAASALAELLDSEVVVIAESVDGPVKRLSTHVVFENECFRKDYVFDIPEDFDCPIFDGGSVIFEDGVDAACTEAFPFLNEDIRFLHGVPIEDQKGQAIGVTLVASKRPRKAQKDHDAIFKIFTSRAAAEIGRLRSDRAREAELQRTRLLQKISRALSKSIDPDQVLQIAVKQIGKVFEVSRCHIRRIEGESGPIAAEYCKKPYLPMKDVPRPLGNDQYSKDVISSDSVDSVSDVSLDERFNSYAGFFRQFQISSILAARTSFSDKANGVLVLHQCDEKRIWTVEEQNLLEGIAAQIGVAIAQAELSNREKVQRIAIEEARKTAEIASHAKGDFLARMSHELRTPMNAILGFSQLLSSDENLTDEQIETLAIINRSGEHLTSLINDVLEVSKIEAGKSEINRSCFSPLKLVHSLTEMFKIRSESKGLSMQVDMPDNLVNLIESDENKLRQILTNLLGNALKFTNQGGIELKAWYFSGNENGASPILAFRVKDSGIGISKEAQERLFSPFVQVSTDTYKEEGTGLGLTITKAFVELLGGGLRVESKPNEGSEFTFWIPCAEVKEETTTSQREGSLTRTHRIDRSIINQKPTVLIADDQPENRLLAVRFLKSIGYTVLEAVDGQDAIDVFRQSYPEAILMDIRMPGTDGLAATDTIRKMEKVPHQPVIIALTGNAFEEDRDKALAAGCDDFLAKPFKLDELSEILTKHLGKHYANFNALP